MQSLFKRYDALFLLLAVVLVILYVQVAGGGRQRLEGAIAEIGNNVHSKSRVEAIPVIDVLIELKGGEQAGLKPGQSVQVVIPPAREGV